MNKFIDLIFDIDYFQFYYVPGTMLNGEIWWEKCHVFIYIALAQIA